jgi:hypothetical protein
MTLVATKGTELHAMARWEQNSSSEIVVLCPHCKALETLQIAGGQLTPTRKFTQDGAHIYHDCGSISPCRLYSNL